MVVQPRLGVAVIFAEPQDGAELFRLDPIEAGHGPDRQRPDQDQGDAQAGEMAAGQELLQAVLTAPQQVLKIGRPRAYRLRAGAPWSFRTRAPRTPALIFPRHRRSLLGRTAKPLENPGSFRVPCDMGRPYKGPPRPLQCGLLASNCANLPELCPAAKLSMQT